MNNNLKNYTQQPSPEVWNKIQHTLRRRTLRRQICTAAIGFTLVAAAVAGVMLWPKAEQQPVQLTAKQSTMPTAVVAPEIAEEPTSPTVAPMRKNVDSQSEPVALRAESSPVTSVVPTLERIAQPEPIAVVAQATQSDAVPAAQPPAASTMITASHAEVADNAPATPSKPAPAKATSSNVSEDTILWIPNIFMPASDDADLVVFRPRLNKKDETVSKYKMTIFTRSGQMVFVSNDISYGWDGTYRGVEQPQAAYVYVINYMDAKGLRHQRKGTVTLVR